jgi:hypothetical protein
LAGARRRASLPGFPPLERSSILSPLLCIDDVDSTQLRAGLPQKFDLGAYLCAGRRNFLFCAGLS